MARKIIKPLFFEVEGNESLTPGRLARSPPSLHLKSAKRGLCEPTLGRVVLVQVGGSHGNDLIDFFHLLSSTRR